MTRPRFWWFCLLLGPALVAGSLWAGPEDSPAAETVRPVPDRMCARCHAGVSLDGTSHGVLSKTDPGGSCESCHGSAAAHVLDPEANPMLKDVAPAARAERCLSCHRTGPDHVTAWADSEFAAAGKTCADCHAVHEKSDRHLTFAPAEGGKLGDASCRVCHVGAADVIADSFHAGVTELPGGACEVCHGPGAEHVKAVQAGGGEESKVVREPADKACLLCHQSAPEKHAKRRGFPKGERACTVCHDIHVHRNDPLWADEGNVKSERAGNEACAKCHGDVVELTAGSVHAKVSDEAGCERCHGPGSAHIASGGRSRFIVNPVRATPEAASAGCLECHGDKPDHAKDWKGGLLEKNGLSCLTCHQAHGPKKGQGTPLGVGELPAGEAVNIGSKTCAICHQKAHPDLAKSHHAGLMKDEKAAGCESCHGPGSKHVATGGEKGTIVSMDSGAQVALCFRCHGIETKLIRWKRSEHAKAGLDCLSCHDPLAPVGKSSRKQDPESCYVCHQSVRAQMRLPNAHPVEKGAMKCGSCHDPHSDVSGLLALSIRKDDCVKCHEQYRGPFLHEHRADAQDGCLACHLPHGSTTRRLLTHHRVSDLCIQCHVTPASHVLGPGSSFENCLSCHRSIHGSYVDENLFR